MGQSLQDLIQWYAVGVNSSGVAYGPYQLGDALKLYKLLSDIRIVTLRNVKKRTSPISIKIRDYWPPKPWRLTQTRWSFWKPG